MYAGECVSVCNRLWLYVKFCDFTFDFLCICLNVCEFLCVFCECVSFFESLSARGFECLRMSAS